MKMPGSRRMGRFICLVLFAFVAGRAMAAGPATTLVQDVVYRADGTPASGALVITWPAFVTAEGDAVAAGSTTINLGNDGSFSVALAPNAGATPSNSYYAVTYKLAGQASSREAWVVPTVSPAKVAAVRASVVPSQMAVQALTSDWADANLVTLAGGQTIAGAKNFSIAPSVPDPVNGTDAANKEYVDQNAAGGPYAAKTNTLNTWTQPQQALCINGRCNESVFGGATLAQRIASACAQFAGIGGVVEIPISETDATFQPQGQMREGCIVEDERGIMSPNQIGGFNTSTGANAGEGLVYYQQMNTATPVCCSDKSMMQFYLEANSGGYNTWNGSTGTKTNYTVLQQGLLSRTPGQHIAEQVAVSNFSGQGDTTAASWQVSSNSSENAGGDEGTELLTAGVTAGLPAMTGTVKAISGNTITITCGTNCNQLGEQTPLVVTSRNVYANGTASIAGAPPVITGVGTGWSSLRFTGANLFFEFPGEVMNNVHLVLPVASIASNTQATLALENQDVNVSYQGNVTSGAYKIYQGSMITAVPYSSGQFSVVSATVADGTQFQVGDAVMAVGGADGHIDGFHVVAYQNVPYPANAGSTGYGLQNSGTYPMYNAVSVGGPGGFRNGIYVGDWSTSTVNPQYGVELLGPRPNAAYFMANDPAGNNLINLVGTWDSTGVARYLSLDRSGGNNFWRMGSVAADNNDRLEIGGSQPQANLQLFQYISPTNSATYTARQVSYYANPNANVILDNFGIGGIPVYYIKSLGGGAANFYVNNGNSLVFNSGNQTGQQATINGATGAAQFGSVAGTGAATFAAGAAAGTSPGTAACASGHVCDSLSGTISFTVGTSTAAGALLTVTTTETRANQANCVGAAYLAVSPYTPLPLRMTETTTTVVFNVGAAPVSQSAYELTYVCGGV